jgi:hypothetical protein
MVGVADCGVDGKVGPGETPPPPPPPPQPANVMAPASTTAAVALRKYMII